MQMDYRYYIVNRGEGKQKTANVLETVGCEPEGWTTGTNCQPGGAREQKTNGKRRPTHWGSTYGTLLYRRSELTGIQLGPVTPTIVFQGCNESNSTAREGGLYRKVVTFCLDNQ
jgi:hypothetical protein